MLAELTRAHLLSETSPGRYACHDLLRAYATELAHGHDGPEVRDAALRRLLDHYLHTTHNAATLMEPYFYSIVPGPPAPGAISLALASTDDAVAWLTAERATLQAAVRLAADTGLAEHTWQLAVTQSRILVRRGMWDEQAKVCEIALNAACREQDLAGQAHSRYHIAVGYARAGRAHDAVLECQQALAQFESIGDRVSQAIVHGSLAWFSQLQEDIAASLRHSLRAQELFQAAGHRAGQAMVLNDIGFANALLGNYAEGLAFCEQSLREIREVGTPSWEASTWDSLGYIHSKLGDYELAVTCYERSIELFKGQADEASEADVLDSLGDAHHRAGQIAAAHRAWARAMRTFDEIGHPDADRIRAKLRLRDSGQAHRGAPARPAANRPHSRAQALDNPTRA
jgi:tetratricopeptide (TPR) repeat protein